MWCYSELNGVLCLREVAQISRTAEEFGSMIHTEGADELISELACILQVHKGNTLLMS
ncbi:hypothetical protein DPMN_078212 [Dreissena polymorpha]|uniref:Uncharacterized protein n=1 Tax=Dreissena polymorpha TaxID=45954 RepID=A0A9D3YRD9_DREPO|nr:hypothetical protein DPMN_078212 [Dreissena polymorpha]